jgi:hypothetical protein
MKYSYYDFTRVSNVYFDRIDKIPLFIALKILLLLFHREDGLTKEQIYSSLKLEKNTSSYNSFIYCVGNKLIIQENDLFKINFDIFPLFADANSIKYYYSSPGFTCIPNKFFIDDLNTIESAGELKVLLFFFRKTYGFHRDRFQVSQRNIATTLSMSLSTVNSSLKSHLDVGRIIKLEDGTAANGGTVYVLSSDLALKNIQSKEKLQKQQELALPLEKDEKYDVYINKKGFNYGVGRKGKKENYWNKVSDENFTIGHLQDMYLELCYWQKYNMSPNRQFYLKFNAMAKSAIKGGYTVLDLKNALNYARNFIMREQNREIIDLEFWEIKLYLEKAKNFFRRS